MRYLDKPVWRLMRVTLTNEPDSFKWRLTKTVFSQLSLCMLIILMGMRSFLKKYLWRIKVCTAENKDFYVVSVSKSASY
jgi:hypothetical protein